MTNAVLKLSPVSSGLVIGIITFATVAGAADVLHWRGWVWTRVHRARLSSLALVILIPALGLCWYLLRIRPDIEQVARRGRAAHLPFERYPGESDSPTMSAATTDTTPKIGSFGNLRTESKLPASDDLPIVVVTPMTFVDQDTASSQQPDSGQNQPLNSPDFPSLPLIEPARPPASPPRSADQDIASTIEETAVQAGPRTPFGSRPPYRPVQRSWIDASFSPSSVESAGDVATKAGPALALAPTTDGAPAGSNGAGSRPSGWLVDEAATSDPSADADAVHNAIVTRVVRLTVGYRVALAVVMIIACGTGIALAALSHGSQQHLIVLGQHGLAAAGSGLVGALGDLRFWACAAALTVLAWWRPAQAGTGRLGRGVAEDAVWLIVSSLGKVTLVAGGLVALGQTWSHLASNWSVDLTGLLGVWGVAVLAFVIADLLAWTTHWAHHRVPQLWVFHAVHHSQERMNALSDARTHVVENLIGAMVVFIPGMALGLNTAQALMLTSTTIYFSALIHSNVRTNLGPLRHVFVSPQAHRIHHSLDPTHFDSNYATVFSFWDRLFGTLHPDHTSYPTTGVADPDFPRDSRPTPQGVVALVVRQNLYPFAQLTQTRVPVGSLGARRARRAVHHVRSGAAWEPVGRDDKAWEQSVADPTPPSASSDLPPIPTIEPIPPSATAPPAIEGRVVPQPTEAATPVGPRSSFGTRPSYRPVQRSWIDTSSSAISAESTGDITGNTGSDLAVSPIPAGGATAVLNRPASAQKAEVTHHDEPEPQASLARPGWLPDPLGRHQHRWWDGSSWTDAVVNDNTPSRDSGA